MVKMCMAKTFFVFQLVAGKSEKEVQTSERQKRDASKKLEKIFFLDDKRKNRKERDREKNLFEDKSNRERERERRTNNVMGKGSGCGSVGRATASDTQRSTVRIQSLANF